MSTKKVYQSIKNIVQEYEHKLSEQSESRFQETPPINGWSYSEVYSHIFDASLLSLIALQNCIDGKGEQKPTHWAVKLVLFFGKFPPGKKYKVPKRLEGRVRKIDLTTAGQFISDFEAQLEKVYPQMGKANPKVKTAHPRLGYLNGEQWLRFIEIHLKHHLAQLKRIELSFSQQS